MPIHQYRNATERRLEALFPTEDRVQSAVLLAAASMNDENRARQEIRGLPAWYRPKCSSISSEPDLSLLLALNESNQRRRSLSLRNDAILSSNLWRCADIAPSCLASSGSSLPMPPRTIADRACAELLSRERALLAIKRQLRASTDLDVLQHQRKVPSMLSTALAAVVSLTNTTPESFPRSTGSPMFHKHIEKITPSSRVSDILQEHIHSKKMDEDDEFLHSLGSSCIERRTRNQVKPYRYIDASTIEDPSDIRIAAARCRTGSTSSESFPEKLYRMLMDTIRAGKEDIISFRAHGRAFAIHKPKQFAEEILPKYFKHCQPSSFQRQLNIYGFARINTGPDAGGYYHELFLRGRPALFIYIRRVGAPKKGAPRKRGVKAHDLVSDPDFYVMRPISGTQK